MSGLAARAMAQGYAGLGSAAAGFALPDPARRLRFPEDHLPHPRFRVEWWYLTANLTDPDGREWGAQWTLFRAALDPADAMAQVWMGHAALTTPDAHLSAERLARPGQAGVAALDTGMSAAIDEWRLAGDPARALAFSAGGHDFAYAFEARATGPVVAQGSGGYSVKSAAGTASHYYSQPFLALAGTAETRRGKVPLAGTGWLDREWSSEPLAAGQSGWDWFALSLDSGDRLMAFTVRGEAPFRTGNWISRDGSLEPLPAGAFSTVPLRWAEVAGRRLPVAWRLSLPAHGLSVVAAAQRDDCWMPMLFPYWEGPVRVTGSHPGRGYLEMTGYG